MYKNTPKKCCGCMLFLKQKSSELYQHQRCRIMTERFKLIPGQKNLIIKISCPNKSTLNLA